MKLVVVVEEVRNDPSSDVSRSSYSIVRLQVGKNKYRTKVGRNSSNPSLFEFRVEDLKEELIVSVSNEDKCFNDDIGLVKIPVSSVFESLDKSLGKAWYSLQPKNKKFKNTTSDQILLTIYFSQSNISLDLRSDGDNSSASSFSGSSAVGSDDLYSVKEEKSFGSKSFMEAITHIFHKNGDTASVSSNGDNVLSELPEVPKPEFDEDKSEEQSSSGNFEDNLKKMQSMDREHEIPSNLPGGVLLDKLYMIAPQDLNHLLFSPDSKFPKSLADFQGTTELQHGTWKFENEGENLKRTVTSTKAPTKLIKAVKSIEEQVYLKADGMSFAVLSSVSTPDVMYGGTFKTEVLYCICPGPKLPSGEQSSHFVVSWRMNFLQSTMMKGMIEGGARQGLKESFGQYANVLSENVNPVDMKSILVSKEQVLASLQQHTQSNWKLAVQYFGNFTVLSTILIGLYVLLHICMAPPTTAQGLEFSGLDLPDSIGELIVCGIVVLQGKRVLELMARFMQARTQKGGDHGIKSEGDGWLLTVALIEGSSLAAVDSSGYSDPYVVLTCNGRTRTSSIKFQKSNPQWNEIFEFDAMDEPPSVLDVEVYDFDGPFDEATSLGHSEINFLRTNISDLADVWLQLQGKLAQACQSRLHLRIFLDNTRGGSIVKDYLTKMEKEVGKKINLRSPQTNSAFQKLFELPSEEFLVNDFTCHLRRKMPLQGRIFLSPRILGFHANLFGNKTKFFFLWEDIEDIQVGSPSLSSMGQPMLIVILRLGRGIDARHGAKSQDDNGRLNFHFHSFVSFNIAHRTVMALWKAKLSTLEQKVQMFEESDAKSLDSEGGGSYLDEEEIRMSRVYSSALSVSKDILMELFAGGELERRVMAKTGCLDYTCSSWEMDKSEIRQRQIYYKLDRRISCYGGEVTSTQQKSPIPDSGWLVEEIMTLHGVPLGDAFSLHLKYQVEDLPSKTRGCGVQVHFGISWQRSTKYQKRITKNIASSLQERVRVMMGSMEEYKASERGH